MKKWMCGALCAVLLTACAGTAFKWDTARQIKAGMDTKEVITLMGKPNAVSSKPDGITRYVWVEVNSFTGTKTFSVDSKDGKIVSTPTIPDEFQ